MAEMKWQPIETAPKDEWIRLWRPKCKVGVWQQEIMGKWCPQCHMWIWPADEYYNPYDEFGCLEADEFADEDNYECDQFTHWMPLPAPPSHPAQGDE